MTIIMTYGQFTLLLILGISIIAFLIILLAYKIASKDDKEQ